MILALAAIDEALGLPDDGCNSTQRTLHAIQRLRTEAARYRWLRDNRVYEDDDGTQFIEYSCDFENWNDIDAAIDAARAMRDE